MGSCLTPEVDRLRRHALTRDFTGKGSARGGEQQGKGNPGELLYTWLAVLGFMTVELVSGCLWPVALNQGPSWWQVHRSAKMDSSEAGSGRLAGQMDWVSSLPYLS